jgi:hypothetical protein
MLTLLRNGLPGFLAIARMQLHLLTFTVGKLAGFLQDTVRNADLADVVSLSRLFTHVDVLGRHSHALCDDCGISADTQNVLSCVVVAKLCSPRRFHCVRLRFSPIAQELLQPLETLEPARSMTIA